LQVIFEKKEYYWIPIDIKLKKEGKLKAILPDNNHLFDLLLESTADSYHFQEFTEYWHHHSGQNFKIIPTNFQNAIIEHIIFFKTENKANKIDKVVSISMGYFRPFKTPKNGWLITAMTEEKNNAATYDLNKPRAYIPPLYPCDLHPCVIQKETKPTVKNIDNHKSYKIPTMDCTTDFEFPINDYFLLLTLQIKQPSPLQLKTCYNKSSHCSKVFNYIKTKSDCNL
jgi:hypothetical protein